MFYFSPRAWGHLIVKNDQVSGGYFWIGLSSGIPESHVLKVGQWWNRELRLFEHAYPHLRKSQSTILLKHKTAHIFPPNRVINEVLVHNHMFFRSGNSIKIVLTS